MKERSVHFYSAGYKLDGKLYLPDDCKPGEKRPAIIPNSGYMGLNEFYPRLFAQNLTEAGFVCLGFDYRGFAESEGKPGRVLVDEQVEDIVNAITFLGLQEEVDPGRIGLIGWAMAAAHVVRVAAADRRVKAVAALNGFFNGERWLRSVHSYVDFHKLLETVEEDRIRRVTTGSSLLEDPFIHYPLDPATHDVVRQELMPRPAFGKPVALEFTESLLRMNAEKIAGDISPTPLFVAHGKYNLLHPPEESLSFFEAAGEPKEWHWIEGKHNDFMFQSHPVFQELMEKLKRFFSVL